MIVLITTANSVFFPTGIQNLLLFIGQQNHDTANNFTVCPRSIDPFYVVIYNIKWAKTSWTHSSFTMDSMRKRTNCS